MEIDPIIEEMKKRFGAAVTYCGKPGQPAQTAAPVQPAQPGDQPATPPPVQELLPVSDTDPIVIVEADKIVEVCAYLKSHRTAPFDYLISVTAADYPDKKRIEVLYFLYSFSSKLRLELKCYVPRDKPVIDSVTPLWHAANLSEREIYDLFGVAFRGHPDLRRIFLEDDFEGYPLRKDWNADFFVKMPEVGFR